MPVAKTYEHMEMQGEPFKENGRMYINVLAPKGIKKVRWYTDAEYRRMYPTAMIEQVSSSFNARHAFGFDAGFITIYKGANVEEWANKDRTNIYFNTVFLYYTPGRLELPQLDNGIEPIKLMWEEIMDHDNVMKPYEEVQKIVAEKLGASNISKYQGEENDWLEKEVTIRENKTHESQFGDKHTHTMVDAEGNIYIWETGAKNYESGSVIKLKMKVKAHKEVNGEKSTVVWYCKEC